MNDDSVTRMLSLVGLALYGVGFSILYLVARSFKKSLSEA